MGERSTEKEKNNDSLYMEDLQTILDFLRKILDVFTVLCWE